MWYCKTKKLFLPTLLQPRKPCFIIGCLHSNSLTTTTKTKKLFLPTLLQPHKPCSIFDKFDKNDDGKISCFDVVESLNELGTAVTSTEAECMIKQFDKDGDGYIDLDEFVGFIQSGGFDDDDDSGAGSRKELKDVFDLYDIDKNGLISASELRAVMKMRGLRSSLSDCKKMIRRVDQDGDGALLRPRRR